MPGTLTVNTAPASTLLATPDLLVDVLEVSNETAIDLITRASGLITAYLGQDLGSANLTETFRLRPRCHRSWHISDDADPIVLSRSPVTDVASITQNGTTLVEGDDYEHDGDLGLIFRLRGGYHFPWHGVIVVTYTAGFTDVPAAVEAVCLQLAGNLYVTQGQDPGVTLEVVEGAGRIQWSQDRLVGALDDGMKATLAAYKTVVW